MTALAAAIAEAVSAAPRRRVPLATLVAAAAAVDRSGAAAVGWRSQIAAAIEELANAGTVELPRTRWDTTSEPPLPAYVTRPPAARPAAKASDPIVWHAELGWAAELDAARELSDTDRRFLASVNTWLRRRGTTVVPQRERSLDICGDEKALDKGIFTPLFAPARLTYEMLRCEPCWPPVHQEILGPGPWLIVENWTTFGSLARAARDCGWNGRLIWGAGNQVGTRLTSLAAAAERPDGGLHYFGDIDTAGFRIARMAASRAENLGLGKLTAARALYQLCSDAGTPRTIARQTAGDLEQWTQDWLGGTLGLKISRLIADGCRIVQETIGVELLATIDTALLFAL
jgi:Uncharacterized protein conserved in bacteria C-term(DUF2220)